MVKDKKIAEFEDQRKEKFRKELDVTAANDEKEQAKYMLQELELLERQRARRFCGTGTEVCKRKEKKKVGRARRGSHDWPKLWMQLSPSKQESQDRVPICLAEHVEQFQTQRIGGSHPTMWTRGTVNKLNRKRRAAECLLAAAAAAGTASGVPEGSTPGTVNEHTDSTQEGETTAYANDTPSVYVPWSLTRHIVKVSGGTKNILCFS